MNFEETLTKMQEKIGKDEAAKIADDIASLLSYDNSRTKDINKRDKKIEKLEKEGKIFVIRPKTPIKIGRLEKDKGKLTELYKVGYDDAKEYYESLEKYLGI